jgi:enoyl-CoA hydratase/carnithine racemase
MNKPISDADRVHVEIKDAVAFVTLNRPQKHNALDLGMFKSIDKVIHQLRTDRQIRAVIVSGKGEDFCTGLDVKSVMKDRSSMLSLLAKWLPGSANLAQRVSCHWRKIPVPVIMVIQGRCWGGGMQIALGADFRFATPDSNFSIMEGRWGLIPDMAGSLGLRENVAKDIAMKLTMTAEVFSAQTALTHGVITSISDDPMQSALDFVCDLSDRSPDAIAAVKSLYVRTWLRPDWVMLARESFYQIRIILGKNQGLAVKKQLNPDKETNYQPRKKWR